MMMRKSVSVAFLSLLIVGSNAAPLGNFNNGNGVQQQPQFGSGGGVQAGAQVSVQTQARYFKGILYLFAPQSWIDAWNAISQEGQECFLRAASDPSKQALYSGDDANAIKQDVQSVCSSAATQISAFIDATESTVNSLPASFRSAATQWGQSVKQLGEQMQALGQQAGAQGQNVAAQGQQNVAASASNQEAKVAAFKQLLTQFADTTATFTNQLATLSEQDRQQVASAFPKLSAFISGPNSVEFLNQLTQLYRTIASGNMDRTALKAQAQQLKTTVQSIWQQYSSQNAEALQQASQIFGQDLNKMSNFMQGGAQAGHFGGGGGFSNPEFASYFGEQGDEGHNNKFGQAPNSFNGQGSFGSNGGAVNAETH